MNVNDGYVQNKLFERIKLLSIVLSILIIYLHSYNIEMYGINGSTIAGKIVIIIEKFISKDIAKFAVAMFFSISGFLFYRNFELNKYPQKLKMRINNLAIPYLCWNVIYLTFYFTLTNIPLFANRMNSPTVVLNANTIIRAVVFYEHNEIQWYVYQLILYTILCPAIFMLLKNKYIGALYLGGLFCVSSFITYAVGESIAFRPLALDSLLYYSIGAFAALYFENITIKVPNKLCCIIATCMLAIGQLMWIFDIYQNNVLNDILFKLLMLTGTWILSGIIVTKEWVSRYIAKSKIKPFFVYCFHIIILDSMQRIILLMLPRNEMIALVSYLISPLITLTMIIFIEKIMRRYIPRVLMILSGGRVTINR